MPIVVLNPSLSSIRLKSGQPLANFELVDNNNIHSLNISAMDSSPRGTCDGNTVNSELKNLPADPDVANYIKAMKFD